MNIITTFPLLLMVQKSQTTTWDVYNLVDFGINCQPQLVSLPDFSHQQYHLSICCFTLQSVLNDPGRRSLGRAGCASQRSGVALGWRHGYPWDGICYCSLGRVRGRVGSPTVHIYNTCIYLHKYTYLLWIYFYTHIFVYFCIQTFNLTFKTKVRKQELILRRKFVRESPHFGHSSLDFWCQLSSWRKIEPESSWVGGVKFSGDFQGFCPKILSPRKFSGENRSQMLNGTGIFTYIYHKNQPNVGK